MTPGRVIRAAAREADRTNGGKGASGRFRKVTDDLPGVTFLMSRSFRNASPEHAGSPSLR